MDTSFCSNYKYLIIHLLLLIILLVLMVTLHFYSLLIVVFHMLGLMFLCLSIGLALFLACFEILLELLFLVCCRMVILKGMLGLCSRGGFFFGLLFFCLFHGLSDRKNKVECSLHFYSVNLASCQK